MGPQRPFFITGVDVDRDFSFRHGWFNHSERCINSSQ